MFQQQDVSITMSLRLLQGPRQVKPRGGSSNGSMTNEIVSNQFKVVNFFFGEFLRKRANNRSDYLRDVEVSSLCVLWP